MLNVPRVASVLDSLKLPMLFIDDVDHEVEDPFFHLSSRLNISVGNGIALISIIDTDSTLLTWLCETIFQLEDGLQQAMIYHRDVLLDHTYDSLIRPSKAAAGRR